MRNKILSIISVMMIASMMLAGCGAKNEVTTSVSNEVEDTESSVSVVEPDSETTIPEQSSSNEVPSISEEPSKEETNSEIIIDNNIEDASFGEVIGHSSDGSYDIIRGYTYDYPIRTSFNIRGLDASLDETDLQLGVSREHFNLLHDSFKAAHELESVLNTFQVHKDGGMRCMGWDMDWLADGPLHEMGYATIAIIPNFDDAFSILYEAGYDEDCNRIKEHFANKEGYYVLINHKDWESEGTYKEDFLDIICGTLGMITPDAVEITKTIQYDIEIPDVIMPTIGYLNVRNFDETYDGVMIGTTKVYYILYDGYFDYFLISKN